MQTAGRAKIKSPSTLDLVISKREARQRQGDSNRLSIGALEDDPKLLAAPHGRKQAFRKWSADEASLLIAGLDIKSLGFVVIDGELYTFGNEDAERHLNHHHGFVGGGKAHRQACYQLLIFAGDHSLDGKAVENLSLGRAFDAPVAANGGKGRRRLFWRTRTVSRRLRLRSNGLSGGLGSLLCMEGQSAPDRDRSGDPQSSTQYVGIHATSPTVSDNQLS